jgi:hypothetical protein
LDDTIGRPGSVRNSPNPAAVMFWWKNQLEKPPGNSILPGAAGVEQIANREIGAPRLQI